MTQLSPADRLVAKAIIDERLNPRYSFSAQTGQRTQQAILPHVLRRTGCSEATYWRVLCFVNDRRNNLDPDLFR